MSCRSQDILDYIAKAEQVIAGWEAMGGLGGPGAGNMQIISDEVLKLSHIMETWPIEPVEDDPVVPLLRRYYLMLGRVTEG